MEHRQLLIKCGNKQEAIFALMNKATSTTQLWNLQLEYLTLMREQIKLERLFKGELRKEYKGAI